MAITDYSYVTLNGQKYKVVPGTFGYNDVDFFAPQRRHGVPSYQDFAPETVIAWDSWHHGYGDFYVEDNQSYYTSQGVDASIRQQITLAPAVTKTTKTGAVSVGEAITQFIEYGQTLFAVGSTNVFSWVAASSPAGWSAPQALGGIAGQGDVFLATASNNGAFLYVPATTSQWTWDGTHWTQVATNASHFLRIRNELWKAYIDPNNIWKIAKSTDGVTYAAGNTFMVGNGVATITGLLNYDNRLYIFSTEGMQTVDSSGNIIDLIPEMSQYGDAQMGKGAAVFHGIAYIPNRLGVAQFFGSSVTNIQVAEAMHSIGPDVKSWSQSDVRGKVVQLAPHTNFMYATLNSQAGNGYVLKFRDYPDLAPGQGWHPIYKASSTGMGAIKVSALGSFNSMPQLWFSTNTDIYKMNLPRENDNSLVDSSVTYQTNGQLDLPTIDFDMPTLVKNWVKIVMDVTNQSDTTVEIDTSLDGGPFTALGFISATTGNFQFDFPQIVASVAGTNGVSYKIQPRIVLTSANSAHTPVVRWLALHTRIRPQFRKQWGFQVSLQDNALPNSDVTPSNMLTNLETARQFASPVAFTDIFGKNYTVTVERLRPHFIGREPGISNELVAELELQDYSVYTYYFDNANALFDFAFFS